MASALQLPPFVASKVGTVRGRRNRPTSMMPGTQEQPSSLHSSAFVPPPRSSSATNARTERSGFAEEPEAAAEAPRNGTIDSQPRSNAFGVGPAGVGGLSPFAPTPSQPPITEQPPSVSPPMQTPSAASGVGGPADSFSPSMSQSIEQTRSASPVALSPTGTFGTGTPGGSSFSPFASTMSQAPPFRPDSRSAIGDRAGGDTGSIRSARSLTSTGSQGTKHPDLTEAGLSSSVIETVSARFETGKITSSSLIGEIALAYNPTTTPSPSGTENIRLEQFASLDKVAPNPAFITQTPDKTGEYTLSLANLSKTQVAFKYQVRADDAGSQAPMLIAPAFKIEPTQASIIVSYSLNSAFNLHGRDSITLSNVMLALTLEGARATGCQSRPVGTFSRERNLIFWPLGDVTLKAGAAPEKLLARFATESEASGGSVEVRWEITGENAIGLGSGLSVSVRGQAGGSTEDDPFADDDAVGGLTAVWKGVVGMKKLASGAYTAK
ncbi:Suppressor of Profilin deletion [Elasticomyces elasticus]|nr:Suppressor of Profilin deletion [Elasticomyces elasticus]